MKKKFILLLTVIMISAVLAGCGSSQSLSITGNSSPVSSSERRSEGDLSEYSGAWYGFGTDSTEAESSAIMLEFTGGGKLRFGGDTFSMTDACTAESDNDIEDSIGNSAKILLQFGKDSRGELALCSYGVRKSDGKQYAQAMCYYRERSRSNAQDFIPNSVKGDRSSSASGSKDKIDEFKKRAAEIESYDAESSRTVNSQTEINLQSFEVYKKWDTLLNDIFQYLKSTKSNSEFSTIQADEVEWIKKKEAAANDAASEYSGGSMEPMVRNTTASQYTRDRCYYLISLID